MANNLLKMLDDFEPTKTYITSNNFDKVFDEWMKFAPEGHDTQTYVQAFFEDISERGTYDVYHHTVQTASGDVQLNHWAYLEFWGKYARPGNLNEITSQKDRLVDLWSRRTDGEFFTPTFYADLGHAYLSKHLGEKMYTTPWWDMCCGTGNLTKKCPNEMHSQLYMSTLNAEDVDILNSSKFKNGHVFSQDFLNSDMNYDFLETSTEWVFILNPPYSASPTIRDDHKKGVADTRIGALMKEAAMNKASSNLTTQFLWKIKQLVDKYNLNVTVGMFTQISFAMNPTYSSFYQEWLSSFKFIDGFCFHCSEFEGTTGEWPVVFSIWSSSGSQKSVDVDVYENRKLVGKKAFFTPSAPLSKWVKRPKNTIDSVPFTSAITVASPDKTINLTKLPEDAMGFAVFAANDVMHSKQAYLLSAPYANGSGWGITKENFEESLVALGLRAIIKGTWLNDKDQFNAPDISHDDYINLKNNLIVWLLFSNFNHSASLIANYNGEQVDIKNHFFWLGGYVNEWLSNNEINSHSSELLKHCNLLYEMLLPYKHLAEAKYQLNRDDSGWYQWRKALCGQNAPSQLINSMYTEYKQKHKSLTNVLVPMVYDLNILPKEVYFSKMKNSKQVRLHTKR
jgi:hypothetical protein